MRSIVLGSVSVERKVSKSDELGSGAAIGPWEWSIFGRMAASKPRRVGQGSKGLEGSLVDGMVPRKGSANAPFHGLDEVVSMKWSGVLGAGTPANSKGAGRAKSPASG